MNKGARAEISKDSRDNGTVSARILVVDDDNGLNNLAQKALSRAGFKTDGVLSATEAIEKYQADPETVMLLDNRLPDMSGIEMMRSLINLGHKPYFVAMTGHGDEEIAVEMMKLGAKDYLVKGFDLTKVLPQVFNRVFNDIKTEKRLVEAETELKKSERDKRLILESTSDIIAFYESPDLRIKWANKGAAISVGLTPEGMCGRHCYELWAESTEPCPGCPTLKCFETGQPVKDMECVTPDGRAWMISVFPVHDENDQGQQLQGVVEFAREVTEQKKNELALLNAEIEKQTILDHQRNHVILQDSDHKIIWANRAALESAGLHSRDEIQGRYCYEFWTEDSMPCAGCPVAQAFESGETRQGEKKTADGRIWQIYGCPIRNDKGEITHAVEVTEEITDKKKFEEKLQEAKDMADAANNAKSYFLANMSHELRTPMNGIMGMLQILETTALDSEQEECVDIALKSSKRLVNLLSDIVDLSRIEVGKVRIDNAPFDFMESMRIVEQLFQPACGQKELKLNFHVDSSIPRMLVGDQSRLQQILNNLIGNAVKYSEKGTINVEAYPLPADKKGGFKILFSVSDTGMGIADDKMDYLFEPFTQADEGFTRKFQGAGLGLAIVSELVAAMGGNISVSSELGSGTTFYFCLSFDRTEKQKEVPRVSAGNSERTVSVMKILLVEDDKINQVCTARTLEKRDYVVRSVENGREALDELRKNPYDLVLMDIQMPVMDGVEATKAIRNGEAGEENRDIPVIAITAHAMQGDREYFLQSGMDDYLAKPVEVDSFLEVFEGIKRKG